MSARGAGYATHDENLGANGVKGEGRVLKDDCLEDRDEIERETDQMKCSLGAMKALQTESIGIEVILEFFDAVLAITTTKVEAPDLEGGVGFRRDKRLDCVIDDFEQSIL